MPSKYVGPERREYCAQHCHVMEVGRKSVPRWVFLSSLSTMVAIAISFAGWYITSLNTFKIEIESRFKSHELHLEEKVANANFIYTQDVRRFIKAIDNNGIILSSLVRDINSVKVRLGRAEAKQDLILEKIQLTK